MPSECVSVLRCIQMQTELTLCGTVGLSSRLSLSRVPMWLAEVCSRTSACLTAGGGSSEDHTACRPPPLLPPLPNRSG